MNKSAYRRQRGFTLIELLIGIVILGIVVNLALPSYQTFIENGSIRTAAESLQSGLQLARSEALRRNARVRFVMGTGSNWTVSVDGTAEQIQARSGGEGAGRVVATLTPSTGSTVTFNSFGRVVTNADATPSLTRVVLDISATTRDMRIEIEPGGQIRLCDPSITTAGDVRRCLQ